MSIRSPKWLILATLVANSPDTPGVYELWEDDELVYVHATHEGTLRDELVRELLERDARATHFSWEISFAPAEREQELLAEFEAEHHKRPKLNG
jgi:hypothetical protein